MKSQGDDPVASIIFDTGIIAIIRAEAATALVEAARAIAAGGVPVLEITLTTPGALGAIEAVTDTLGEEVIIGAGTVLDPESARAAIAAGARFIVSPTLNLETIALCRRYAVPVFPGAYTPTELLVAWEAGATAVKLFPAATGGPGYVKSVKAPLPQLRLVPTGGVDLENAAPFLRAGASALGVGSALVSNHLLAEGEFSTITERARRFRKEVERVREQETGRDRLTH